MKDRKNRLFKNKSSISEKMEKSNVNESIRSYMLVGRKENWKTAIEHNVWGFTKNAKGLWNTSKEGEILAYYVTAPLQKIIGFGRISGKVVNNDLIWKEEKLKNQSIWSYKLNLEHIYILKNMNKGVSLTKTMILENSRKILEKEIFDDLVRNAEKKWNVKIPI